MSHIINNYFKNVYLIAHPSSKRYKDFNERWQGLNYELSQFVHQDTDCIGIDGFAQHNFEFFPNNILLKDPLSRGQIAVSFAHMLIYKQIIEKNLHNTLIFEDDSVFVDTLNLEECLEMDWDILSLFSGFPDGSSIHENVNFEKKYTYEWDRQGISAYIIRTPKVADYILKKQLEKMDTADGAICDANLKVLALFPGVCTIDNSPSLIVNGVY